MERRLARRLKPLLGLNKRTPPPYIPSMAKSRVPSPQSVLKVHRLPVAGQPISLVATVLKVHDQTHPRVPRKVTLRVPGYPIPITISERELLGEPDDA